MSQPLDWAVRHVKAITLWHTADITSLYNNRDKKAQFYSANKALKGYILRSKK